MSKLKLIKGGLYGTPKVKRGTSGPSSSKEHTMSEDKATKIIKVVKFVSGEEIVTHIRGETDMVYSVGDTLAYAYHQTEAGKLGVSFMPFMPNAEKEGKLITKSSILAMGDPGEALLGAYEQAFSPIIQPPHNIITP